MVNNNGKICGAESKMSSSKQFYLLTWSNLAKMIELQKIYAYKFSTTATHLCPCPKCRDIKCFYYKAVLNFSIKSFCNPDE